MGEEYLFNPSVFEKPNEREARDIILTDEAGLTSDQRWERETSYLAPYLHVLPWGPVLDIGCGIGRLSKVLTLSSHTVVGVDESESMRKQAVEYVDSPFFQAVGWSDLKHESHDGVFRSAIAVWVLQHIPPPHLEAILADLYRLMPPDGVLLLVNRWRRVVPVVTPAGLHGWLDDGYDVSGALLKYFDLVSHETMPLTLCSEGAYLRRYRRKP
jgi:cyclopropane fatty-acyl-phospholipid synthase-like methyltransferase